MSLVVATLMGSCRLDDSAVSIPTGLHPVAIDTRRSHMRGYAVLGLLSSVVVDVLEVKGMEVPREVSVLRRR